MADWSGAQAVDFQINDGDTIGATNNLTINAGVTCTVAAGATVSIYASRVISVVGTLNAIGTLANPITFKAQASDVGMTNGGYIATGADNCSITLNYCKFKNLSNAIAINRADRSGITLNINHIWTENCNSSITESAAFTATGSYSITNVLSIGAFSTLALDGDNVASSETYSNIYSILTSRPISINGANGQTLSKIVGVLGNPLIVTSGTSTGFSLADSYFGYAYGYVGIYDSAVALTLTWLRNVIAEVMNGHGAQIDVASTVFNSSYSDYIGVGKNSATDYAIKRTNGDATSDYDYVAGCAGRTSDVVDTTADTQVNGVGANFTRTNEQSAPNKPLTVDNVAESSLTSEGVTITFDSAAGATGYRCDGVGFVRYGTTSGVYTHETNHPTEYLDLGKAWTGWSSYSFKTTAHSVALVNLKSGTTYYYQACFIDPLGRIGVSSEGSFTTSGETVSLPGGFL
jgi:hypothetical protein